MQQMYSCPRCGTAVRYGQNACTNCNVILNWEGISAPPPYNQPPASRNQNQYPQQDMYGSPATTPKKKSSSGLLISMIVCMVILLIAGVVAFIINGNSSAKSSSTQPNPLTSPSTPPTTETPPAVTSFSVNPPTITAGQTTNLSWDVSQATSVSIDQGIGTIPSSGTQVVSPTQTTTYTLTATNSAGSATATATVTLNSAALPVITAFTASPDTINAGQSSTLKWNITGATSVSINQGIGTIPSSGTQVVSPTQTTTYTLTATNSAGSATATATVTLNSAALPVITAFTASPDTINAGQSSTLQWIITGASSISLDQGIGTPASADGQVVSPTQTATYTLTATNSAGFATATATVTVNQTAIPVITAFTASPTTINAGQSSTLQWNITGTNSVSIDQGIGTIPSSETQSGTQIVSPTTTTTYTLTATNNIGSVTASAAVSVTASAASPPVITGFTASPSTINAGQSSTLQWNITGATSVSINQGIGTVSSTTGTQVVTPSATTTYTLTATNSAGSTTMSATVTVTASTASLPVIISFTANPSTIAAGSYSTLQWNITGATSASIDQGVGALSSSFGEEVSPVTTTTYTLTATNSAGSVTASTTVTVH
jgi:hypothetical protein